MLYRIPKLLSRWSAHHKNYVQYIIAIGLSVFASPIIYAILPIIAAAAYGEWRAGILISGFGFAQAFLFDPIAGSLADKIGSRRTVLIGLALGICAGLVWITFSIQHLSTLLAFSFLLFLSYGFRGTAESYVLKTSKKDEGGL
ncbi:MAG: MFS transporter, partial [Candidatus Magasanikbacteria bacterium]|nr:MFS transporter [Candidatus Magasanikbacteria bacterium]